VVAVSLSLVIGAYLIIGYWSLVIPFLIV